MKYKRVYEGGELAGYECEKGFIEVYNYDMNMYGDCKKYYIIPALKAMGKPSGFSLLRDAKSALEKM